MKIPNFRHKGLKKLYETGNGEGLPVGGVEKLIDKLAFLSFMTDESELHDLKHWKAHTLTGDSRRHLVIACDT